MSFFFYFPERRQNGMTETSFIYEAEGQVLIIHLPK